MARRTITTLVDGTDLGRGPGETLRFDIDGRDYEIDLSDDNTAELRETLRPYTAAARRIAGRGSRHR